MTQIQNPHLERSIRVLQAGPTALEPEQPLIAAEVIGAQEAVGFYNPEWQLHIALYAFESQSQHETAKEQLKPLMPMHGFYTNFASNGAILYVGFVPNDGSNGNPIRAKHQVARLTSLFAGEE